MNEFLKQFGELIGLKGLTICKDERRCEAELGLPNYNKCINKRAKIPLDDSYRLHNLSYATPRKRDLALIEK